MNSDHTRNFLNQVNAGFAAAFGTNGFFSARPLAPWLQAGGTHAATSFYDTSALKTTLERLVDFDRLNAGMTRFSAGAVNVRTGNLIYFDSYHAYDWPEHILASGALPPGFPAIEIDGEHYWDGGLVSNTPLQWVIECGARTGHACVSGRPLERARPDSAQYGRGRYASKGGSILEPHTSKHRPVQAPAPAAASAGRAFRAGCLKTCVSMRTSACSGRPPLDNVRQPRPPD